MGFVTMESKDTVLAKMAECYIVVDGNRYNFMQAINLEAKMEKTKTEVPILGRMTKGNRVGGLKGTGSATFHMNNSMFRKLVKKLQDTGEDFYFDIQITNFGKGSAVGNQTIILKDCNIDSLVIAKFDADSDESLQEEFDFTFESFEMPEEFKMLDGMR